MAVTTFIQGQTIEGTVTGGLCRKLIADEYHLFADFLVTRVAPSADEKSLPIRIVFFDEQNDILNLPRNSIVRAKIDLSNTLYSSIYSTSDKPIHLTDIEFVERGTGRVISRIPNAPRFED